LLFITHGSSVEKFGEKSSQTVYFEMFGAATRDVAPHRATPIFAAVRLRAHTETAQQPQV
jgi:hypothetical protein